MTHTTTHFAWDAAASAHRYRAGVSLHSHTAHSLETLAVVSTYAASNSALGRLLDELKRRSVGSCDGLDYSRIFFRPPLEPHEALEVERRQIEVELGLQAIVSLTDHDTFEGCTELRREYGEPDVPCSIEWTVPFGPTYLHLGLHNVPEADTGALVGELARVASGCAVCRDEGVVCFGAHRRLADGSTWGGCSLGATARPLADVLARIAAFAGSLVVLNHPMWDMNGIGDREHAAVVGRFLSLYGEFVHAIEVNGLRPWRENVAASRLADVVGRPVVAGGDRHGREPAAVVSLTGAGSFEEFAADIRRGAASDVLVLPHYREPLVARKLQAICDVLRDDPPSRARARRWTDRVFVRDDAGVLHAMTELWPDGGPATVRVTRRAVQSLERWPLRQAVRMAFTREVEPAA